MPDDVVKQAAMTTDDDVYNESLQTNARLMVSPYTAGNLNYLPRHHYQHHHPPHQLQQQQHFQSTPGADKRWLDVTTIISDEGAGVGYTAGCGGERHVDEMSSSSITCSAARLPVCATHMYESPRFQ